MRPPRKTKAKTLAGREPESSQVENRAENRAGLGVNASGSQAKKTRENNRPRGLRKPLVQLNFARVRNAKTQPVKAGLWRGGRDSNPRPPA